VGLAGKMPAHVQLYRMAVSLSHPQLHVRKVLRLRRLWRLLSTARRPIRISEKLDRKIAFAEKPFRIDPGNLLAWAVPPLKHERNGLSTAWAHCVRVEKAFRSPADERLDHVVVVHVLAPC